MTGASQQVPLKQALADFVAWRQQHLSGDEKGEAQIFLERLFQALGHDGLREAGATLEQRIKRNDNRGTAFADLMWKPRCLIEMKRAKVDLKRHYRQAFDYWVAAVPDRPRYVILSNFDEFWIYDFDQQLDEPVDRIKLTTLPDRWEALTFLLPERTPPKFGNDLVQVTRDAAAQVASVFNSLQLRGVDREKSQTFVLQTVMAMFAEDIGLLPSHLFTAALDESLAQKHPGDRAYDLVFGLFREMNAPGRTTGGRFKGTPYFNGGLFSDTSPLNLEKSELQDLRLASATNWTAVRPEIFGTLFEQSMDAQERHAYGAHFTSQADIARIVIPTVVSPWRERIAEARTRGAGGIRAMERLLLDMSAYRVLDPAVGSGNFLYVAYREMRRLEYEALSAIADMRNSPDIASQRAFSYVTTDHFLGMDVNKFAVEVAKVTMMLAKKLSADELEDDQDVLPLDNLDQTIVAADALFTTWPRADAIIGNPPYLGRRKMQDKLGIEYCNQLARAYPDVGGVSDFVSYWFPLAHDHLAPGGRAGFVATNSVRQNESRKVSLDYIVDHGGSIYDAVSSQPWSGDAAVHVSIINWIKGEQAGEKVLWLKEGDLRLKVDYIPSSLTPTVDVRTAAPIEANRRPATCFQGQTPGVAKGFILSAERASSFMEDGSDIGRIFPYVGGDEVANRTRIDKHIIDLEFSDLAEAELRAPRLMQHLRSTVLPTRIKAAEIERARAETLKAADPNARANRHHAAFLDYWWRQGYRREEMLRALGRIDRYLVTPRYSPFERPTFFTFVDSAVRPGDGLTVIPLNDDYSFGILSSAVHRTWIEARCSTFGTGIRYTSTTVWDSFPWPQQVSELSVKRITKIGEDLLTLRSEALSKGVPLSQQYELIRTPGKSRLRDLHQDLDNAVLEAYGFTTSDSVLAQLFALNQEISTFSVAQGPGPCRHGDTAVRSKYALGISSTLA